MRKMHRSGKGRGKGRGKKMRLGGGGRFKAIERKAAASGASDPRAVAAAAGIAKYGKRKMSRMAQAGKRRKSRAHSRG